MAAATSPAAAGPAETSVSKADVLERHFLEGLRVAIRNLPSQSHGSVRLWFISCVVPSRSSSS